MIPVAYKRLIMHLGTKIPNISLVYKTAMRVLKLLQEYKDNSINNYSNTSTGNVSYSDICICVNTIFL